jgi:hypothetical protein
VTQRYQVSGADAMSAAGTSSNAVGSPGTSMPMAAADPRQRT